MCLVILNAVTPDLYKYKALRLSYENASIFATFALVAFIPGLPYTHLVILRALARRIQLFFKLVLFVIKVQPRDLTFESCCFCV